jgi:transaldolase
MAEDQDAASRRLEELTRLGQSIWLDYIGRDILTNGDMARMIRDQSVRGVTSNPAIFEKAITGSDLYDDQLSGLVEHGGTAEEAFEALAIQDIRAAADLFRPLYDRTDGGDGFVSLEVSPTLAEDTEGTIEDARRLWKAVDRPNVMIKVPGTEAGAPAVETLLTEGINVNITLLFSLEGHERVMEAYLRAMEKRLDAGQPVERVASVASYFVSRVDTAVDLQLEERAKAAGSEEERKRILALRGKAAIANAKMAYQRFREIFDSERFERLRAKGARVQRPLWASTSTKNPEYRDVMYVEQLIGPDTVNTMPRATMEAFADHGVVERTVDRDLDAARAELHALKEAGIDLDRVTRDLQVEGVEKFVTPYNGMLERIEEKLSRVAGRV